MTSAVLVLALGLTGGKARQGILSGSSRTRQGLLPAAQRSGKVFARRPQASDEGFACTSGSEQDRARALCSEQSFACTSGAEQNRAPQRQAPSKISARPLCPSKVPRRQRRPRARLLPRAYAHPCKVSPAPRAHRPNMLHAAPALLPRFSPAPHGTGQSMAGRSGSSQVSPAPAGTGQVCSGALGCSEQGCPDLPQAPSKIAPPYAPMPSTAKVSPAAPGTRQDFACSSGTCQGMAGRPAPRSKVSPAPQAPAKVAPDGQGDLTARTARLPQAPGKASGQYSISSAIR